LPAVDGFAPRFGLLPLNVVQNPLWVALDGAASDAQRHRHRHDEVTVLLERHRIAAQRNPRKLVMPSRSWILSTPSALLNPRVARSLAISMSKVCPTAARIGSSKPRVDAQTAFQH